MLVRRDAVVAIGGFDESMQRSEDYEFVLRLVAVADAVVVEQRAAFYRLHGANKSASRHGDLLARNDIAERIAKNPQRYPAGARAHFSSPRVANINAAAKTLLRSQRYREAREIALLQVRLGEQRHFHTQLPQRLWHLVAPSRPDPLDVNCVPNIHSVYDIHS